MKQSLHKICGSGLALFWASLMGVALFPSISQAQVIPPQDQQGLPPPDIEIPGLDPDIEKKPEPETGPDQETDLSDVLPPVKPDYSHLSAEEERTVRLDALFNRLASAADESQAELIAEEIWAIWLDSGSASINFVLRRGSAAQKRGESDLARRMYDQTLTLSPDYAEGWARSSRLALEEKNLSRSLTEAAKALALEPRHFYALWTMGNVFEQLDRNEEALEAYREAHRLHPQLKAVKDRLAALESALNGDVL